MKAVAMKASAKKASAMKRTMKAKRVSIVATGARAKSSVFSGRKMKTSGGLTKEGLIKNKVGKIVSKKRSAVSKRAYASSKLKAWADAVKVGRKALGITGFVAVGGKSGVGKALYVKAKSILSA